MRMKRLQVMLSCLFASASFNSCSHSPPQNLISGDTTASPQMGPLLVSLRPPGAVDYYVEVKPEFDHVRYAHILAGRVGGKVGYIFQNFHGFTIHTLPESAVDKLRRMPEVLRVIKSSIGTLD